jgi:hypothetical protein
MKRTLLLALLALAPLVATAKEVLPFVQDDYATAIARAKAKHLPMFVEAWAPW